MRTIETRIFGYEDLLLPENGEVLERVLYTNSDLNTCDSYWYESTVDLEIRELEAIGFQRPKISFSGFWSQGDGACISASQLYVLDFLDSGEMPDFERIRKLINKGLIGVSVSVSGHERGYYSTVRFDYAIYGNRPQYPRVKAELERLEEELEEWVSDKCHDIHKRLEREYEYLSSEEAILATIQANGYEFTEDGKII